LKGNIAPTERAEEGRALARLTDLGWGGVLRTLFDGGAADAPLTDALRGAAIRVLTDWPWAQRPASVLALPSRRRPLLVDSLARSLAEAGRLPFLGSLSIRHGGPSGEPGGNSVFRLAGLWDRFDASGLEIPEGPVLLVDDLADSRWTLTVAAREVRRAGASAVLPFTLALRA
jgi:ATP-dependent DNA helicase RecQ